MNSRSWSAVVILAVLFGAIYLPGAGHGFVKDDYRWIEESRLDVPSDVSRLLTTNVGFYRPIVAATFALDYRIWGLDPRGFALTNLLLFLADAGLLFLLGRRLSLPPPAALFVVAAWAFNFHGVNMAVLWISGRTALLVILFALASALTLLNGWRLTAGALTLGAMLCKEEAIVLPALLLITDLLDGPERDADAVRAAVSRSWPLWTAAAAYAALRTQSGAFGPLTAPSYYRFTLAPGTVLNNVGQYLDRAGTYPAAWAAAVTLWTRPRCGFSEDEWRVLAVGTSWFVALFAITVFLPVRSNLYALAPSIGSCLIGGAFAARAWRAYPVRFERAAAALIVAVTLLLPAYRSRNHGLVEPADLAAQVLKTAQERASARGEYGAIMLVDQPGGLVTFSDAFGGLFANAVRLFIGPQWNGAIVLPDAEAGGRAANDLVFELRDGAVIQAGP